MFVGNIQHFRQTFKTITFGIYFHCSVDALFDSFFTDRTTRMLLAVLLLFLTTEFPQGILGLLSALLGYSFFTQCYLKLGKLDSFIISFKKFEIVESLI